MFMNTNYETFLVLAPTQKILKPILTQIENVLCVLREVILLL